VSTLRVFLLGTPKIERDGAIFTFGSLKAQALFYYLIATRQLHAREKLAALFWGDTPDRQAKGSLRNALYELRRSLDPANGPSYVRTQGGNLVFNRETEYWLDVEAFEQIIARAGLKAEGSEVSNLQLLEEAVGLYRSDFLDGFALKDAYDFDDWVFFERDRLQRLFLGALSELSEGYAAQGDFTQAIACLTRILSVDNLQEHVHRQLMRLYYAAGNRNAALRQYETCKAIMERELGVAPLAETTGLYEQILNQTLPPPVTPRPPLPLGEEVPKAGVREQPARPRPLFSRPLPSYLSAALIGRQAECDRLRSYLEAACQGNGRLVLVEGEVGVGKTRLVQEALGDEEEQLYLLAGRCYESEVARPYQAVVEALRDFVRREEEVQGDGLYAFLTSLLTPLWLAEISRLLPELCEAIPNLPVNAPLDATQERSRLFEAVAQLLIALGRVKPIVLFLDDLHWADEDSLQLLQYLARATRREQVLLLAAYRSEEQDEPLTRLMRGLAQEGCLERIALRRLTLDELTAMIRSMAGMTSGGERFSRRIYQETAGNPFFTTEVIRSLFEAGVLRQEAGGWTTAWQDFVTGYQQIPIPPSVRDVIHARLDRLDEATRQLLETAAVARHQFTFATVWEASGKDELAALDAFDRMLQAQFIRELPDSGGLIAGGTRYEFSHEMVREVAYQRLSGARRQHLHRRVAETLERQAGDDVDEVVDQLAFHYAQAGDRDKALHYALQAGDRAARLYAHEKALEHYSRALELARDSEQQAAVHERLGDVYTLLGQHDQAIDAYQAVLKIRARPGTGSSKSPPGTVAEIHRKIARVYERSGDYGQALEHLTVGRALLLSEEDPLETARLDDGIALVYIRQSRYAEAVELCQRNLEHLARLPASVDARTERTWLDNTLGSAYLHLGNYSQAIQHFQQSLALRKAIGDTQGVATLYNNLGVVHYFQGDYDQARPYYEKSFAIKKEIGDIYGLAISATNLGLVQMRLGQFERALENLRTAVDICKDIEATWLLPEAYRILAETYLALEDVGQAERHSQLALDAAQASNSPVLTGVAHRTLGKVAAHGRHDWDEAACQFQQSVSIFESLGNAHELGKTCYAYGVVLAAQGQRAEARTQLERAVEIFNQSGATGRLARARAALAGLD
jgi:DNA-binding SARP family transcriptional activator